MTKTLTQHWVCKKCGKVSEIVYEKEESMESILEKVKKAHHKLSPQCPRDGIPSELLPNIIPQRRPSEK